MPRVMDDETERMLYQQTRFDSDTTAKARLRLKEAREALANGRSDKGKDAQTDR